jgi:SAM-dependent methyltransferase
MPASAELDAPASERRVALARLAYEELAPYYDRFTHDYEYEKWLEALESWAWAHGLSGRRVLDVACGTGKSFAPLLAKGYDVTACDLSPAMVAEAQAKWGDQADVVVGDMRALPWAAQFDLVTCLDDAVNYLVTERDLLAALSSMAMALAPAGVLIFDINTLVMYRDAFGSDFEKRAGDTHFRWRGEGAGGVKAGGVWRAVLEIESGPVALSTSHVQRHWPLRTIQSVLDLVGFSHAVFRGQETGGQLVGEPDEMVHPKIVCLATSQVQPSARANPQGGAPDPSPTPELASAYERR